MKVYLLYENSFIYEYKKTVIGVFSSYERALTYATNELNLQRYEYTIEEEWVLD